ERITALHAEQYPDDLLLSVPGVGAVIASVLRGHLGNLERFTNLVTAAPGPASSRSGRIRSDQSRSRDASRFARRSRSAVLTSRSSMIRV
ncbi:MAG: hypothetical protein EA387_08255, partial [Nitriliruptor sp.]